METRRTVLVTGAGRGIGRAVAERLSAGGWQVHAGVRDVAHAPPGTLPVPLDVTDEEQVAALDRLLPARLDAVVNNAGIVVQGPVEALTRDDLRRQFEVNVVGLAAVTRAVLPRLRESRGRIVLLSSVSGRVATPMTGAYCASKHAVEALGDALRLELRPWGIRVSMIEPGAVDTDMWRTALDLLDEGEARFDPRHRELYARHTRGARRAVPMMQRAAAPSSAVAAAVEKALTATRPRARYAVGLDSRVQLALRRVAPTPVLDTVLGLVTRTPR